MAQRKSQIVWALRKDDGKLMFASGNYLAPWIFGNREGARKAARECREHAIQVTPVRIGIRITTWEVSK